MSQGRGASNVFDPRRVARNVRLYGPNYGSRTWLQHWVPCNTTLGSHHWAQTRTKLGRSGSATLGSAQLGVGHDTIYAHEVSCIYMPSSNGGRCLCIFAWLHLWAPLPTQVGRKYLLGSNDIDVITFGASCNTRFVFI
jgi:hypothetical protein